MIITKKTFTITNVFVFIGIFFGAFWVSLHSGISPFVTAWPGTDSSVFLTIANGMMSGKIPYVDFFDHKGPFLYLINYFGLVIGGTMGVWIVELIFIFVFAVFAYKSARLFSNEFVALVSTLVSCVFLTMVFDRGNLTEIYALPFLSISFYIFSAHFLSENKLGCAKAFITGVCCGLTIMLRPNMFGCYVGFYVAILFFDVLKKNFCLLFSRAIAFLLGIIVATLPFLIYLAANNALREFIYQCFIFNSKYATESIGLVNKLKNIYSFFTMPDVLFLVSTSMILFFSKQRGKEFDYYIAFSLAALFSILLILFSRVFYKHYNMALVPLLMPALACLISALQRTFSKPHKLCIANILVLLVLASVFVWPITLVAGKVIKGFISKPTIPYADVVKSNSQSQDKIIVLGNYCKSYFLLDREPASKYIYQFPVSIIEPTILEELYYEIEAEHPEIIITTSAYSKNVENSKIKQTCMLLNHFVENNYVIIYSDDENVVFKKRKHQILSD